MVRPALTLISFGSQRRETHHKSLGLLKERFGDVEWLEAAGARPRGDWIWCIPERCELSLGALLRVEGILEQNASGVHFFRVENDLEPDACQTTAKPGLTQQLTQRVVSRFSFLRPPSLLMKRSTWEALLGEKSFFEIAEMGLAGIESELHECKIPYELHPERLHSEISPLRFDWKRLYLRSRNWLRPWEHSHSWQRRGVALVCLVRTPGVSNVKPELAKEAGKELAEAFYRTSLEAVEGLVEKFQEEETIVPYWAIEEADALEHPLWSGLRCVKQGEKSAPENIGRLYLELLAKHRAVLFLGSDCPQLSVRHLKAALRALKNPGFVFGPASSARWYLWGGNVELPELFWDAGPLNGDRFWGAFRSKLSGFASVVELEKLSLIERCRDLADLTEQTKPSGEYSRRQFEALQKLRQLGTQALH
jgi:uncharacterized protein